MLRKILLIILLFLLFVSRVLFSQTPLSMAPNFSVIDARGNYHDLYSYLDNGKYVLLDFFYNECLVCQSHIPEVNDAFIKFGCNTNDVFFMGINFENTDGEVISFENEYGVFYPNVSGIDGGGNDIVELFLVIAFPTIILISPDHTIPLPDIWPLTSVNIVEELLNIGLDTIACPYAQINSKTDLPEIMVFPNPVSDFIHITSMLDESNITITIHDFIGREVYSEYKSLLRKEKIDISSYMSGIYFLQIHKDNILLYSEKIIKH